MKYPIDKFYFSYSKTQRFLKSVNVIENGLLIDKSSTHTKKKHLCIFPRVTLFDFMPHIIKNQKNFYKHSNSVVRGVLKNASEIYLHEKKT